MSPLPTCPLQFKRKLQRQRKKQMATCEHTCPLKPYVHIENHISSHATPIFMFTLATNANEITNAKIMKNKSSAYMEAHMSTQALCTH